jgi:AbrB family looped-hinge helix DNA binding protein
MRITSKGQVTIPKHIREKLGVKPGDEVGFREEGQQVILQNEPQTKPKADGEAFVRKLVELGERARREGWLDPDVSKMSVDEYMELIRGYSEDADDPGFKRRP